MARRTRLRALPSPPALGPPTVCRHLLPQLPSAFLMLGFAATLVPYLAPGYQRGLSVCLLLPGPQSSGEPHPQTAGAGGRGRGRGRGLRKEGGAGGGVKEWGAGGGVTEGGRGQGRKVGPGRGRKAEPRDEGLPSSPPCGVSRTVVGRLTLIWPLS